nr:MAG TPA: carboxypeptidase [Caudoviricetes sp.]
MQYLIDGGDGAIEFVPYGCNENCAPYSSMCPIIRSSHPIATGFV